MSGSHTPSEPAKNKPEGELEKTRWTLKRAVYIVAGIAIVVYLGLHVRPWILEKAEEQEKAAVQVAEPASCTKGVTEILPELKPQGVTRTFVPSLWSAKFTPGPETGLIELCADSRPSMCWDPNVKVKKTDPKTGEEIEVPADLDASWIRVRNISAEPVQVAVTKTCP